MKTGLKFAFIAQTTLMRKIVFLFITAFTTIGSFAQLQVGVFGGVSNYLGDITDKLYQNPGAAVGLTVGYQISSRTNLRAGFTYGKIMGADSLSSQEDLRLRNLNFQSSITELSLVAEFTTFDMDLKRWSPYAFGGLAVFHFNPYTYDRQGNKTFLQPLSTEGQGLPSYQSKPYSLTQLALPFGAGIKYNFTDHFRIGLEVGLRKLFTDYLDDLSTVYADPNDLIAARGQEAVDLSYRGDELPGGDLNYPVKGMTRGSSKYKDYYYFSGIHLVYLFGSNNQPLYQSKTGKKKYYDCPKVF